MSLKGKYLNEKELREYYSENLKALEYADYLRKNFGEAPEMPRFIMTFLHDVVHSGRFKTSSLLEIGSGPLVHCVASASALYSTIVMSDYLEENCEELKKWLKGQSSIQQLLDIPLELEGQGKDLLIGKTREDSVVLLEDRIRKRIKQVVRCDLLTDEIFLEELVDDAKPPYDLVISCFTLEAAATDFASYLKMYKRINSILRPGGGMVLIGCFEGKLWTVNDTDYPYIDLKKEDIMMALKEAGFGKIEMKTQNKVDIYYEYDKLYCLVAEKL